jgi:hypothetical protein
MSVLSKKRIQERLGMSISKPESLVLTPLLSAESFDEDSIDLRLGTHFLLPQIPPQPYMDQGSHEKLLLHISKFIRHLVVILFFPLIKLS